METRDVETTDQVNVTIKRPIKVIHFSDGIEEEIEEVHTNELASAPHNEDSVDPKTLTWGPWFSHYAKKSGSKVLGAVDYAGESLANFFGITTPKYQIEIDEYERVKEEKKKMEEESAGWVPKNSGGNIPLVLNEPSRDVNINTQFT
ncbi:PREDICTED: protein FAM177A1-like [Papilio xuthus]|uniref:Protein FAM177A1-like n=1 Tax=Papilio xuthus TaxID=66420 RepID=A0AAJ6YZD0_PAPXU|nr:PREDICTED: protein FAM177A1-like [Papilio xuthus]